MRNIRPEGLVSKGKYFERSNIRSRTRPSEWPKEWKIASNISNNPFRRTPLTLEPKPMFQLAKTHPRYPKYKPTNIDWIGDIPDGWNKIKASTEIKCLMGAPFDSKLFSNEDWKPLIRIRDLNNQTIETYYQGEYDVRYLIQSGDHLVWMDWDFHNVLWQSEEWLLNQRVMKITVWDNLEKKFFHYLLSLPLKKINDLTYATTVKHLSDKDVRGLYFYIPQIEEQRIIVSYLDEKTALIDEAIAKKQRQIELLSEHRTALINNAITKGLDPNAEMKDSGIEWIGMIPKGWEVRRIKTFSQVRRWASPRPIDDPKYFDEQWEYSWVRIADVSASWRYLTDTTQRLSDLWSSLSVKMAPGDLFVSIAGTVWKAIISEIKCCIHDGFVYFDWLKYNKELLYWIFTGWEAYKWLGKLGTQLNLNTETIWNMAVPFPPKEEQGKIVEYIDKECAYIDTMKEKIQQSIDLLQEYKTSLISHVVSGKIRINNTP